MSAIVIPTGYAPTKLTVRWNAGAVFSLSSGYTGYVKAHVEYSLNGGGSWADAETPFEKTQAGPGSFSYTLSPHNVEITLLRTQDPANIHVRATLIVQMPVCLTCNNTSQANGSMQVADIRVDADCEMPNGESTSSSGWLTTYPYRTIHNFQQTLSPGGTSFVGRLVKEQDPLGSGGTDNCYDTSCPYPSCSNTPLITSVVTGAQWTVASGNTWGYDQVGWNEVAANWYQAHPPTGGLPCSAFGPQQMLISCLNSSDFVPYRDNTLEDTVGSTTIASERDGNYQSKNWP